MVGLYLLLGGRLKFFVAVGIRSLPAAVGVTAAGRYTIPKR